MSGFGADGPYVDRPVYDPIIQAISGMAEAQNGTYVKAVVADKQTAMAGANAILAALVARSNGAGGQHIEIALLDAMLHWMWLEVFWNESLPEGEPAPTYSEWYEPWDTADGQIAANWVNFGQYKGCLSGPRSTRPSRRPTFRYPRRSFTQCRCSAHRIRSDSQTNDNR